MKEDDINLINNEEQSTVIDEDELISAYTRIIIVICF